MAPPLLRAFSIMRPRLEAERTLAMYEATLAGSGRLKKADTARWVSHMRKVAGQTGNQRRPSSASEWASLGMRVHDERKKEV